MAFLVLAFLPSDLFAQNPGSYTPPLGGACADAKMQLAWIQITLAGYGAGAMLGLWIVAPEIAGLFTAAALVMQLIVTLGC
jgi:hypothetical protein